jgi:hypothetical protein
LIAFFCYWLKPIHGIQRNDNGEQTSARTNGDLTDSSSEETTDDEVEEDHDDGDSDNEEEEENNGDDDSV